MVYFVEDLIRFFKIIANNFQNVMEDVNIIMKSAKTLAEESAALFLKLFSKRAHQIKNLQKLGLRLENKIDANGIVQIFYKEINIFEGNEKAVKEWLDDVNYKSEKKALEFLEELLERNKFPKTRKATNDDIDELAKIRKFFSAGKKKNVAFTKGEIGGKKIDIKSRSGEPKVPTINWDNFKQIEPENYHYKNGTSNRIFDSEQKQIEYLYEMFKHDRYVKGEIEIVSDLKICDNCNEIIKRFKIDFPNIDIIKVWVKNKL